MLRDTLYTLYNKVEFSQQDASGLDPSTTLLLLGFKALMDAGDTFVTVCGRHSCPHASDHGTTGTAITSVLQPFVQSHGCEGHQRFLCLA